MNYNNPIRILTPDQIKRLDASTLKSIKKEILLHFQLSDEPTIERNGIMVDKNEVLEIFNELQKDITIHLQIHENKKLRAFLEQGDLSFFNNSEAQNAVLESEEHSLKINGFIASKLNQITAALLENVSDSTQTQLKSFFEYTSKMSSGQQDKAYNKAYVTLKAKVDDLPVNHPDPFLTKRSMDFHNAIPRLVDLDFYNCFPYLPGAFKDIAFMYAVWCHNNIVNGAFRRQNIFEEYKRRDLVVLLEAYDIATQITTSDNFRQNGRDLRQFLGKPSRDKRYGQRTRTYQEKTERRESKDDGYGLNVLRVIAFVFILIRILSSVSDCSNSNSYERANRYDYNQPFDYQSSKSVVAEVEKMIEDNGGIKKEELQKIIYRNNSAYRNESRKALEEALVGDKKAGWGEVLTRVELKDSLVEMDYDVQVLPTRKNEFVTFIPSQAFSKFKGQEVEFLLQVRDPDFSEQVFQHRFKYSLKKDGRRRRVIYDGRKNKSGDKDHLILDRMRKNGKSIKGSITRYTTSNMESIKSTDFQIDYDKAREDQPIIEGTDGAISDGRFEKYNGYQISENIDPDYKNLILNNLNQIHYKDLKLGNYYTLQKMQSYLLLSEDLPTGQFAIPELSEIKGSLNYYMASNEDDIAYCSVNGIGYAIRYLVDRKAKKVIRMQMAVSDLSGTFVEVIEVVLE